MSAAGLLSPAFCRSRSVAAALRRRKSETPSANNRQMALPVIAQPASTVASAFPVADMRKSANDDFSLQCARRVQAGCRRLSFSRQIKVILYSKYIPFRTLLQELILLNTKIFISDLYLAKFRDDIRTIAALQSALLLNRIPVFMKRQNPGRQTS